MDKEHGRKNDEIKTEKIKRPSPEREREREWYGSKKKYVRNII